MSYQRLRLDVAQTTRANSANQDVVILFPFHIPIPIPISIWRQFIRLLVGARIIPPPKAESHDNHAKFRWLKFPVNFVTAPLAADLFLLATLAIGRQEVHDGTIGANNIVPYDIMIFFLSLAYIAISVDASGLIRWLAYKVLQRAGDVGHRLFFYLYAFFFGLGSLIGNDPIILSGTAFLAYMTRVSQNIEQPTAWIYTQFAVANIASAILVSSNPTNLVLAGAFGIRFLNYTANIIVPVIFTVIILFPFLMYIVFNDESLIPSSIKLHELSDEAKARLQHKPVNPNIPNARGTAEEQENAGNEEGQVLSLEEILHPFLDKSGAAFSAILMSGTLISILALNAAAQSSHEYPVFWVTLPASVVSFGYDLVSGWLRRKETREIARKGREEVETAKARAMAQEEARTAAISDLSDSEPKPLPDTTTDAITVSGTNDQPTDAEKRAEDQYEHRVQEILAEMRRSEPKTLQSQLQHFWRWCQETFPTAAAVLTHLPLALVPFAFCMFILVQALVTKGWVPVFAHGWNHWVRKTGTVGSLAGMGFLSTVLCNVS